MSKLSPRQDEIANLIADDLTVEQISVRLSIQVNTVIRHLADVRRKKRLTSTVQIANYIWKRRMAQRKPTYNDVGQQLSS